MGTLTQTAAAWCIDPAQLVRAGTGAEVRTLDFCRQAMLGIITPATTKFDDAESQCVR